MIALQRGSGGGQYQVPVPTTPGVLPTCAGESAGQRLSESSRISEAAAVIASAASPSFAKEDRRRWARYQNGFHVGRGVKRM